MEPYSSAASHVEGLLQQVLSRLQSKLPQPDYQVMEQLTDILRQHNLGSLLEPFQEDAFQAAEALQYLMAFIRNRAQPVEVAWLPLPDGQQLFMSNCPDVPYLCDSLQTSLQQQNLSYQILAHPILAVKRQEDGFAVHPAEVDTPDSQRESLILVLVADLPRQQAEALSAEVRDTLQGVLKIAADQSALRQRLLQMKEHSPASQGAFWDWLAADNFWPVAYRCLEISGQQPLQVKEQPQSRLGLGPAKSRPDSFTWRPLQDLGDDIYQRTLRQNSLVIEETERHSRVLRDEPLVYIGVRQPGAEGRFYEHAFTGLFTEQSRTEPTWNVPALRQRMTQALATLKIHEHSYDYRKAVEVFNTFPKTDLFFMGDEALLELVRSFTYLHRQSAIKLVLSPNLSRHGLTLLLVISRHYYSPERMARMEQYLQRYFKAPRAEARVVHVASGFISVHVKLVSGVAADQVRPELLERGLTKLAEPWEVKLRLLLVRAYGQREGQQLLRWYEQAFSDHYRSRIHPRFALRDIRCLEKLRQQQHNVLDFWGAVQQDPDMTCRLQFYSRRHHPLNELMPYLENLNLCVRDEVDFTVTLPEETFYIKSFGVAGQVAGQDLTPQRQSLLDALQALLQERMENDYLNRLLPLLNCRWQDVDIFRAYRNYLFQIGSRFTKRSVAFALINNPQVTSLLLRYFQGRFDPENPAGQQREEQVLMPLRLELVEALEAVADIQEDRILRTLFNLMDSTVRTNFYRQVTAQQPCIALKLSAMGIMEMPVPRPMYEVYVHAAHMEGIHLRGGPVARGGIRWSERPDDFRTEVLGLMKTQMTKNALIVPVGSKGGFVVKPLPAERGQQLQEKVKQAYTTLMCGLLDITDNRHDQGWQAPDRVVAYDEPDPYLVVAPDKGTAHLSDTANSISADYGFWLGDAFASGGSHGYDHKELGITARGAWVCVQRHFLELGMDVQQEPATVIGIGDMSGDVFGNGMLLSPCIKLKAAFNHKHIFIDPDPDAKTSYEERQRLFQQPGSGWQDYDSTLISTGGGVYQRQSKQIQVSEQVRCWLNLRSTEIDGESLIRALLQAQVDLLWNGGIGTYVKGSGEKHSDVGDSANDAVRIDAAHLQARVVGEGGNLGFTQAARIEYALAGGRINTDAVDNSGGVDCSDHEVNLKILLQTAQQQGRLDSLQQRDYWLQQAQDQVCANVLHNNYMQALCLSLDQQRCRQDPYPFLQLSEYLVGAGRLDRRSEGLPTSKEVLAREDNSYTRPELAILMAYAKMQLSDALLEAGIPDHEALQDLYHQYFPEVLHSQLAEAIKEHPLRREITATMTTNFIVDHLGSATLFQLARQSGTDLARTALAYLGAERLVQAQSLRQGLYQLDHHLAWERQYVLLRQLENSLVAMARFCLRRNRMLLEEDLSHYQQLFAEYGKLLPSLLESEEQQQRQQVQQELQGAGMASPDVQCWSAVGYWGDFLQLLELVEITGQSQDVVARTCAEVRRLLRLPQIWGLLANVPLHSPWDRGAQRGLKERLHENVFTVCRRVLEETDGNPNTYLARYRSHWQSYQDVLQRLQQAPCVNLHPFMVLQERLSALGTGM